VAYVLALQSAYRERVQDMVMPTAGARSVPSIWRPCTTHFSVVDRSTFGSKYVLRQSGLADRRW